MELDDCNEPPKKKLKQAQLTFCNQSIRTNKRKCNNDVAIDKQNYKLTEKLNGEDVIILDDEPKLDKKCTDITRNKNENKHTESDNKLVELTTNTEKEEDMIITSASCIAKECQDVNDQNKIDDVEMKENILDSNTKKDQLEAINLDSSDVSTADDNLMENEETFTSDLNNVSKISNLSSEDERNMDKTNSISSATTPPNTQSSNAPKRKLTPKTLEKRQQRDSIKQEKLQQKEREKEAKLKLKMEKEEQKRKEKEEKEEQKRKEKEEKERKRLAELKQKEDEKRLKEEERKKKEEAKEEEKRLKEEERRRKEEAKEEERRKKEEAKLIEQRKEDQAKKAFSNFFILKKSKPSPTEQSTSPIASSNQPKFMPFPVKPDMRLAVNHRRLITDEHKIKLDLLLNENNLDKSKLYLAELKNGEHIPLKSEPTWPLFEEQHDVIIVESVVHGEIVDGSPENSKNSKRKLRKAKLLQFHENRRPAYWGTWRKKRNTITPRRPFFKEECLNYEVDSDSEWEDEGEGEDIGNEDDSDKEQSDDENSEEKDENGYVLDNTFVPHGYLSDEEVQPDEENFDPEDHKLRLKVLRKEFEEEMKTKTERLKPRLLGCVWISNDTTAVSKGSLYEVLMKYRAVWDEDNGSITVLGPIVEESPSVSSAVKNKQLSPAVMEQLVKFIHGNHLPFLVMVQEFRNLMEKENLPMLSKRALSIKIKEISSKEFDEETGKHLWCVNNDLCNEYGLTPLSQMNNSEKVKDTLLTNFLKRPSVSPQQVQTTSLPTTNTETNSSSGQKFLQPPSTPVAQPIKKRATLITLAHTPTSEANKTAKVHKDTPRPVHAFFKKAPLRAIKSDSKNNDLINLYDDDDNNV